MKAVCVAVAVGGMGAMNKRFAVFCTVLLFGTVVAGQGRPPEKSAKPADKQPDISGMWGSDHTGVWSLNLESTKYLRSIGMPTNPAGAGPMGAPTGGTKPSPGLIAYAKGESIVLDPPGGVIPYQPWALERRNSVMKGYLKPEPWQVDSQTRGWPNGVPRENVYSTVDGSIGGPIQILQPPGYVVFLYETHHEFRVIPLDNRPQPGNDIKLWEGSSRGRWEGNTLVVEVANLNDSTRLSVVGDFHSEEMRVTERWTVVDNSTMHYRATITDPKVFTQPWTIGVTYKRAPAGTEIFEYAGVEGERDAEREWEAK
jgi:hypothetical protein